MSALYHVKLTFQLSPRWNSHNRGLLRALEEPSLRKFNALGNLYRIGRSPQKKCAPDNAPAGIKSIFDGNSLGRSRRDIRDIDKLLNPRARDKAREKKKGREVVDRWRGLEKVEFLTGSKRRRAPPASPERWSTRSTTASAFHFHYFVHTSYTTSCLQDHGRYHSESSRCRSRGDPGHD